MRSAALGMLVVGIVAIVYLTFPEITTLIRPPPDDPCGPRPANAILASDREFNLALAQSVAVFEGNSSSEILDNFPLGSRNAQMAMYMGCKAAQQGLITSNKELLAYIEAMKYFFETEQFPDRMTHEGTLRELREFLERDPGQSWTLNLSTDVEDLLVPRTVAASPQELIIKICNSNSCIACENIDGATTNGVVSVSVSEGGELSDKEVGGKMYRICKPV